MEIDQDMMDEDIAEDTMMELHHDSSESDDAFESDNDRLPTSLGSSYKRLV
jgi:hypothetical protein